MKLEHEVGCAGFLRLDLASRGASWLAEVASPALVRKTA